MQKFKIVPLSEAYASKIRMGQQDEFGIPVVEQMATGKGPCRVSLKPFEIGKDKRLLIKHTPFEMDNAFNQPGPIFIHEKEVPTYKDIHRFPPEIKSDPIHFPLTLIGYNQKQEMVSTHLVGNKDVDELIKYLFAKHDDIAYLHARNAEAGCYICKIERA